MKDNNRFSVASIAFGISPIILFFMGYIIKKINLPYTEYIDKLRGIIIILIIISPFFAILFGIISLKSEKRILSIVGILLGVIAIITNAAYI